MKNFRLLTSSKNLNSFGLRGYVLIAADGEAWEIGCADGPLAPVKGKTYGVIEDEPVRCRCGRDTGHPDRCECGQDGTPGDLHFFAFGWELPSRLSRAPANVIALVWPKAQEDRPWAGK